MMQGFEAPLGPEPRGSQGPSFQRGGTPPVRFEPRRTCGRGNARRFRERLGIERFFGLGAKEKPPVSDSQIIGMEDLLGRYREAGQVDSSGSFTLDPKKAIEKLAEFQLPSSYHWILKLVQSLHLSGARVIDITAGIHSVKVVCDAVPSGFHSMEDLLGHLLADPAHSSPTLRHLAAGLQGSLAVRPREVRAVLTNDGEVRTYVLRSGGWREDGTTRDSSGRARFELTLNRNLNERIHSGWFTLNTDIFDLFFRRPGAYDRENAVIFDACPFSNCEVRLSGKVISQRAFGHARFPGYEIWKDPNPGERTVPLLKSMLSNADLVGNAADRRHHLVERVVPAESGVGFRLPAESHATLSNRREVGEPAHGLRRAYAIRMELSPLALLVFIEDGVIIETKTLPLKCPGLVALIDASPLKKDLTTLSIVDGDQLVQVFDEVRAVGAELRQEVADNINRMPGRSVLIDKLLSQS